MLEISTILSAIKRRNVLIYRVNEKVKKIQDTKDPKKKAALESERSEFRTKAIEVTSVMHPQVKNAIRRVEQMVEKMLRDYVKLNYSISMKRRSSLITKEF